MTISIRTTDIPATEKTGQRVSATVRSGEFKGKQNTLIRDLSQRDPHETAARALLWLREER